MGLKTLLGYEGTHPSHHTGPHTQNRRRWSKNEFSSAHMNFEGQGLILAASFRRLPLWRPFHLSLSDCYSHELDFFFKKSKNVCGNRSSWQFAGGDKNLDCFPFDPFQVFSSASNPTPRKTNHAPEEEEMEPLKVSCLFFFAASPRRRRKRRRRRRRRRNRRGGIIDSALRRRKSQKGGGRKEEKSLP